MQFYNPADSLCSRFSPYRGGHDKQGNLLLRWNHRFQDLNEYHNLKRFLPRVYVANGQYLPLFPSSLEATIIACNDLSSIQTS